MELTDREGYLVLKAVLDTYENWCEEERSPESLAMIKEFNALFNKVIGKTILNQVPITKYDALEGYYDDD
jgi:hypothetical protein